MLKMKLFSTDPIATRQYFKAMFSASDNEISSTIEVNGYPEMANKRFDTIRLLGSPSASAVTVNGSPHTQFTVNQTTKEVRIFNLALNATEPFLITITP
jgi:hypothetical protein